MKGCYSFSRSLSPLWRKIRIILREYQNRSATERGGLKPETLLGVEILHGQVPARKDYPSHPTGEVLWFFHCGCECPNGGRTGSEEVSFGCSPAWLRSSFSELQVLVLEQTRWSTQDKFQTPEPCRTVEALAGASETVMGWAGQRVLSPLCRDSGEACNQKLVLGYNQTLGALRFVGIDCFIS